MILALSQQSSTDFGRATHGHRPPSAHYTDPHYELPRSTPLHHSDSPLPSSDRFAMSHSHRGLPPPAAMTLPDLSRPPMLPSQSQSLGSMPAPPNQWHGAEESMRNWLSTKAEEERRKQEEEKTRQESLRLEQRRVEQSILRESMQGGVPPQMIPIIFAGIGGQPLGNASAEWLQQYTAQLQASHRRTQSAHESGMSSAFLPSSHSANVIPPPPSFPLQHPGSFSTSSTTPPETSRPAPMSGPTSAPRSATQLGLSRLNTVDLNPSSGSHASQQPQQSQQSEQNTSPSIYFHHWMPPATQETKGTLPPTPSGKEPSSAQTSHVGDSDHASPRKRKATGTHQANAPPTQISPSLIHQANSRRTQQTHTRSRSTKSDGRADADKRQTGRRDSVATSSRSLEDHRFSRDPGWAPGHRPDAASSPRRETH